MLAGLVTHIYKPSIQEQNSGEKDCPNFKASLDYTASSRLARIVSHKQNKKCISTYIYADICNADIRTLSPCSLKSIAV